MSMTMAKIKDALRDIVTELDKQGKIIDSIAREHYIIKDILLEGKRANSNNSDGSKPGKPGRPSDAASKPEPTGKGANLPG